MRLIHLPGRYLCILCRLSPKKKVLLGRGRVYRAVFQQSSSILETVEHFNFFACNALNTRGFRRDGIPYARQLLESLLSLLTMFFRRNPVCTVTNANRYKA